MPPKHPLLRIFGILTAFLFAVSSAPSFGGQDKKEVPKGEAKKEHSSTKAQLERARESLHEAQKELAAKAERIRELEKENRSLNEQTEFAVQEIKRLSKLAAKHDIASMRTEGEKREGKPRSGGGSDNLAAKIEQEKMPIPDRGKADERKRPPVVSAVYYERESAVNFEERDRVLREVRQILEEFPDAVFSLSGHADDSQYAQTNLEVSLNRAEYLAAHLRVNGVPRGRLIVRGAGSDEPSEEGNRRVEIQVGIPHSTAKRP